MGDATGFEVHPRPEDDRIDLLLIEGVSSISRLTLPSKDASVIAGQLLGAAA